MFPNVRPMQSDDTETTPSEPPPSEPLPSEPPVAGTDVETLLGALERQRRYIAWKCGDLDSAALRQTLPPSTMTLGGLLKHLALVEEEYFSRRLLGREFGTPWDMVDWDADPDWEWRTAADDTPEQLFLLWQGTAAKSREAVAGVLSAGGTLDEPSKRAWPDGRVPSLRRLVMDMIEEYARHVGHADLIRESIDGLVGEDPA